MLLRKKIIDFGYISKDYEKIIEGYILSKYDNAEKLFKFKDVNKYLENFGFDHNEIIKMGRDYPEIYAISAETLQKKIDGIKALGYDADVVKKIVKSFPAVLGYDVDSFEEKVEGIKSLGYTRKDALKVLETTPNLFGYDIETIKEKIKAYKRMRFDEQEILTIAKTFPLFVYDPETIRDRKNAF